MGRRLALRRGGHVPRRRSRTASPASAASTAETVHTQYAADPPCSSATTPASQAPGAMPALIPVCTKPIASLSRDRGTDASISENSAISVGASARPVRNRASVTTASPGRNGRETVPTASTPMPIRAALAAARAAR